MRRRQFLQLGTGGVLAGVLGFPGATRANTNSPDFRLVAANGQHRFLDQQAEPTGVMRYNDSIPGPLIRIPRARESVILFHNALDESSSVHWHGLRIENAMDGVPGMTQDPVLPGDDFIYRLNPPDAGTYWYHSHSRAWQQMALGLAGVLIVDEDEPPRVDQDLVFAVDDWRLQRSGQIERASFGSMHDWSHAGRVGNFITVNGQRELVYPVSAGERLRLRMVNIANARSMQLLINEPETQVVALDGQPVKPFRPEAGIVLLAPGQRCDLIIDLSFTPGHRSPIELLIRDTAYEIATLQYDERVKRENPLADSIELAANPLARTALPDRFRHVPLLMEGGAMGSLRSASLDGKILSMRELVHNGMAWAFNGVAGLPEEPLFRVARGSAISLDVENATRWPHAMHIHGHHFQSDLEPGVWRDTLLFAREQKSSMRFVADNPGRWLIHCHMAEHMASGMLTWFEVS